MISITLCASQSYFNLSAFFLFHVTATPEFSTLSLHDALPICLGSARCRLLDHADACVRQHEWASHGDCMASGRPDSGRGPDRKSTRLNSSHTVISYAVFCLKKKKKVYTS